MSYKVTNTKIQLTRGDTFKCKVNITSGTTGLPYELQEGDVVRFALKQKYSDDQPLILKDISSDLIIVINPEDTKPLSFGDYVYDVELTYANGDVDTFIKGNFVITEEVH